MKKLVFLLAALVMGVTTMNAQSVFNKQSNVVNVGIGFGGMGYVSDATSLPAISASYEKGIVDGLIKGRAAVGVGGILAYKSASWKYYGDYKVTWTDIVIGARGAFHYQFVDKLDTYAGLTLGYTVETVKDSWEGNQATYDEYGGFIHSEFIGVRYYFSDGFAVMAELGAGITALNVGVAFKF